MTTHHITIPTLGAAAAWRREARRLLSVGVAPEQVNWGDDEGQGGLFDGAPDPARPVMSQPSAPLQTVMAPRSFIAMADSVVWHSDPSRFARLYAFLWRLRAAPHLMSDRGDADLAVLRGMEKNVRRCQHKMKAFVRFREIGGADAPRRSFAAWFEPTHHTLEPTAPFFARRFADMDWRIVTPHVTASFIDGALGFAEGGTKPELPDDASEALWTTYFRNIFNPARLKVQAMQSEMPKKYWRNMPEAAAIPDLIANAPARARAMAAAAPTLPPARAAAAQAQFGEWRSTWEEGAATDIAAGLRGCTRCDLHRHATQAVPGEGSMGAALMIVGEQPGDMEDLEGRPFIGPAGQLFDEIAEGAGLDRSEAYVTNAVKHFKFKARGRRRIHERPNSGEIRHCRWWLAAEIAQVKPRLILAMGATAAEALTGSGRDLLARRGGLEQGRDGPPVLITTHPSYLLRLPDEATRRRETALFAADLRRAHILACAPEQSMAAAVRQRG